MPLTQRIGTRFVAHRSGVSFSPKDISGLRLWLKADAGLWQDSAMTTPAVNDADVVGGWADQSGNGNHATQATTANKPLLKKAIVNGRDVVRFDAVDDQLALSSINMGTAYTVLAVLNLGTGLFSSGGTWETGYSWYMVGADLYHNGGEDTVSVAKPSAGYQLWALDRSGVTVRFFKSGAQLENDKTLSLNNSHYIAYLSGYASKAGPWGGDVAEFLAYTGRLTDSNRRVVEVYLAARYGITLS